jgi:hypothetical protein
MPWTVKDVDEHKKGLTDKQKKQWIAVANSALKSCMDKGGEESKCAASAIRQANGAVGSNQLQINFKNESYEVREETYKNKTYLVVPVTMMVEGVHAGSHGALLHTIEDLGKFPASWDGRPIVINHPQDTEGNFISANSPDVLKTSQVGRVYNTVVNGSKLQSEAWLDKNKLELISPKVLNQINENIPIEVSVGVFTEDEELETEGDWNGEMYSSIARNHRPDHLAILSSGMGACSIEDGCGIRANKKGGVNMIRANAVITKKDKKKQEHSIVDNTTEGLEERLNELRELVRSLNPTNTNGSYESNYLVEAYDNYLIFEKNTNNGSKYFKQNYQDNVETGECELVGNPVEVEKQVKYVNVNIKNKFKKEVNMADNVGTPCLGCMEKVIAIINSNQTNFTKEDREWLLTQDEKTLDKLIPKPESMQVNKDVTPDQIIQALNKMKPEDRVKLLPDEDQEIIQYGKKEKKARLDNLKKGIQDNSSKELWPDEVLNAMSEDNLQRLFNSVNKESEVVNYSLNGGFAPNVNSTEDEVMYPTGIEMEK